MANSFSDMEQHDFSRPLNTDLIVDALAIPELPRQYDSDLNMDRHDFWYMCEHNAQLYARARELIQDPYYWETEERHFRIINDLILKQNISDGTLTPSQGILHATCPAVDTIRRLFHEYQQNQEPSTPAGMRVLLPSV
jgi:hypothetical protein